jgi:hypothetical protein
MKMLINKLQYAKLFIVLACALFSSCSDYLDVVPDNVPQYTDLFVNRRTAQNALAKLYYYLPTDQRDNSFALLGDEWVTTGKDFDLHRGWLCGQQIMRGFQSADDPLIGMWSNTYTVCKAYIAIRHADLFIESIGTVPDMDAKEKADWKAQATFLKAYFAFLLVQEYGPIVIPKTVSPDSPEEDLFLPRSKVDDCFNYIIGLINEAIPDLKDWSAINELGQVNKTVAKAIKARVLLFRASPFYNGNSEFYSGFLDHDGQPFFSTTYNKEKWKDVIDAVDDALKACETQGLKLYTYKGQPYTFDREDWAENQDNLKKIYDLRMLLVDRWNEELIWGNIVPAAHSSITEAAGIIKPLGYGGPSPANTIDFSAGWLAASYQSMERFYTQHGLPISDDRTVDRSALYSIVTTPEETDPAYAALRGILQPNVETINLYLNREPRFYANLGITGGYWRGHQIRINTQMFYNSDGGNKAGFMEDSPDATGIMVQKVVHPESTNESRATQVLFPWPVIRLADLYLMKAEALNEYSGPSPEVYEAINEVRRRAGIPTVEESYSNPDWVTAGALNKHLDPIGLREIILRERANEFAFEGNRFWDMLRYKRAVTEFAPPIWGWNVYAPDAAGFFQLQIVQARKFSITDCLWPIQTSELTANSELIQNPGW